MSTTRKQLIERNRELTTKMMSLKTAHGNAQRTGADNRTGSPGCGLSRDEIATRCAALRAEMEAVRTEQAAVRNEIEALAKRPTRASK